MRFIFRLALFALLSFLIPAATAQIDTKIPDWVQLIDIKNAGSVNKNQVKEGYYYLLLDEQFNEVKKQRYLHYAKCALTEEALTYVSQIEFSYDPAYEKASLHFVKVHRGKEVIDKTKEVEVKILNEERQRGRGLLNGETTFYTNLSDIRKGDIVEFSYSYTGKNPIMADYFTYDLSLSYSVPVGKIFMRVLFPKATIPNIVYKNTEVKPKIQQSVHNDYVWEVNNPPVITLESSVPYWYDPFATIQISNLSSWNEAKKHCRTFFNLAPYNNSGLKTIVDSIVSTNKYKDYQISAIIEFVQTHVRYSGDESGINSHIPRSPELVLKNRYGDCKEKSVLLNEMLKLIDVDAYPVLVNTNLGDKIQDHVPSISMFDHCISVFVYKNKLRFIDPTISYQRGHFEYRIIPPYKTGMVLDQKDEPFTPIQTDEITNRSEIWEDFTIEESGDARLTATSKYTGSLADEMRYTFLTNSLYDIQDSYKKFYSKYTDDIEVLDTVTFTDNEKKNEFTIIERYRLKNFWAVTDSSQSKAIVREFVPYTLTSKLIFGEENKRKDPLSVPYPLNHSQTITVFKKEGWKIPNEAKEEDNKFFSYSFKTTVKDNTTLELVYDFKSKTAVIEPEDYKDYKSKMDFVSNNIILGTQENPLSDGTIGFNWALMLTIIFGLIFSCILIWHLYKRPFEGDYETRYATLGGWLILLAIGLSITPLRILFQMVMLYKDEIGINYAVFYFNEQSPFFSPMKGYFALIISLVNSFLLVLSILVVVLFYQRKAAFRNIYTFYMIFTVVFLIIDLIMANYFYGDSSSVEDRATISRETTAMFRVLVQACIWVPYIWYSERSQHTFTQSSNIIRKEIPILEETVGVANVVITEEPDKTSGDSQ